MLILCTAVTACTETPSDLPPCVDPNVPCPPYDAGPDAVRSADASADGQAVDAEPTDVVSGP
jgi:hypothetical protein